MKYYKVVSTYATQIVIADEIKIDGKGNLIFLISNKIEKAYNNTYWRRVYPVDKSELSEEQSKNAPKKQKDQLLM